MSSKRQAASSQQAPTTPRRLRSGTQYGYNRNQHPAPPKKDSKKTTKESSHVSDNSFISKGDRAKATKNNSINHEEKCQNRSTTHSPPTPSTSSPPTPSTSSSPKQLEKCQTLKAILESIEPDLSLNSNLSKPCKRKTLRDLLDKNMSKDKKDEEQKVSTKKEGKQLSKSEKDVNNGENSNSKSCQENDSPKDTIHDCNSTTTRSNSNTKQETSPRQAVAHTQTIASVSSLGTVKEEPPDDYWAMKLNYTDNNTARNSVELRIKAGGHAGHLDDHSQTFRISCSRPETRDNSPTALHRNLKPDIVLKVRPRSSSLSALNRSASDIKGPMGTYKTTGTFHGRLESHSQSTIFSTINPLSFKSKSELQSDYEPNYMYGRGLKYRYHCSNSNLHVPGTVLQDSSLVCRQHGEIYDAESLNFDQVNHEDVVEESKLPPVANTVELLSEPHDYHYNNSDTPFQLTDYSAASCSHHVANYTDHGQNSTEPPVLEPMTIIKAEPRQDEEDDDRKHEGRNFELKEEIVPLWGKQKYDDSCLNKTMYQRSYLCRGPKQVVAAFHRTEKAEAEEEEGGRTEDSGIEAGASQSPESLVGRPRDKKQARSAAVDASLISVRIFLCNFE